MNGALLHKRAWMRFVETAVGGGILQSGLGDIADPCSSLRKDCSRKPLNADPKMTSAIPAHQCPSSFSTKETARWTRSIFI
jgi:hypothetical protein